MRRFGGLYAAPALLLLALAAAPLITGRGTLTSRDVLNSHYPMKAAQARLMDEGRLPLVDPYRAGGQPLVGNLNAVPLYPDNLLYLVAHPLWALNAHFWIHLLLAPLAGYWLGRAWGLSRPGAWAVGVTYAGSGYFLSLLNLYNLVAGAALAPAFVAAGLDSWAGPRRRARRLAAGLLWGLLLLAGDPLLAALALLMALSAGLARHRRGPREPWLFAASLGLGSLLAAPQVVELLRILPHSFRGYWRFTARAALSQSWDPRSSFEWLLPLAFGRPDFSFWGHRFYGGNPPLLYSLYPGLLSLGLVLNSGRPRKTPALWAWGAVGLGLFLALGFHNPLLRLLHGLPGASLLRYPIKCWLLVAVGGALLAGLGFERLLEGAGRRLMGRFLAAVTAAYVALWALATLMPPALAEGLRALEPRRLAGARLDAERLRWAGLALVTLVVIALLALALRLARRRPEVAGGALLAVHLASQLFFLKPLYEADDAEPYRRPPELLAHVPETARVVHGGFRDLFGRAYGSLERFPDLRTFWLQRGHFAELYPFSGIAWGRAYDFNHSPEGLDAFYVVALTQALPRMDDRSRLEMLAAAGVDRLILDRPLPAEVLSVESPLARELAVAEVSGQQVHVYEPLGAVPSVALVGTVWQVPHMNSGLEVLTGEAFDPRTMVVVLGGATPPGEAGPELARSGPPGRVEVLLDDVEALEVEVESAGGGLLVTRRAHLPIYRAEVDGEPAVPRVVNLQRLGVEVPAGQHRVRLWVDRRPFLWSRLTALAALLGLVALARRGRPAEAA